MLFSFFMLCNKVFGFFNFFFYETGFWVGVYSPKNNLFDWIESHDWSKLIFFSVFNFISFRMSPDFFSTSFDQPPSNWDMEAGYDKPRNTEKYPFRVFGTGKQASFTVLLRVFNHE